MRRTGFTLVMALAVISLLVAGCGGGDEETATPTPTPEPTATVVATATPGVEPTATPAPTGGQPSGDLAAITGKAADINTVKYDMVMSGPGIPATTSKVWLKQKAGKMKTETTMQGQTAIMLADWNEGIVYQYMPAQNMAIKMDIGQAPDSPAEDSPVEGIAGLEEYNPVIVGSEVVDGHDCWVVEASMEGVSAKYWIWKEKGFPVKVEVDTAEGKMTMEYKNIDFGDIPDSEFELPAGVQIMEMPT
jgi:outer membrane lipoprotein-sorting protein